MKILRVKSRDSSFKCVKITSHYSGIYLENHHLEWKWKEKLKSFDKMMLDLGVSGLEPTFCNEK